MNTIAKLGRIANIIVERNIVTLEMRDDNSAYIRETRKIDRIENSQDKFKMGTSKTVYVLGDVVSQEINE